MSIRARLVEIVIKYANAEITDKGTFVDLGFDSLDAVEAIMDVEDEFDLKISDEEAGTLKTFGDAVAFVEARVKDK